MMSEGDVVNFLYSIPVGTIISWAVVICAALGIFCCAIIKLYKIFDKTKIIKDENNLLKKMVESHDAQLQNINTQLSSIQEALNKQDKVSLKKLRHSIIRAGEEAVSKGYIKIRELRALEELYEEYRNDFKANGYVSTLMKKVRALEVVGRLDENDEDIIE